MKTNELETTDNGYTLIAEYPLDPMRLEADPEDANYVQYGNIPQPIELVLACARCNELTDQLVSYDDIGLCTDCHDHIKMKW